MITMPLEQLNRSRNTSALVRALLQRRHYGAAIEALKQCQHPVEFLSRYATQRGTYPIAVQLKTPIGSITLTLYSWHDARTIHEIFFALDYLISTSAKIIVDFGSNIGISASYFLSRSSKSKAYLFEPVPNNAKRLRDNLRQFGNRFSLEEVAVGTDDGFIRFGIEPTGRYGGIDINTGNYINVVCKDSNHILQNIINDHGCIDVLKVDVEKMEKSIINRLDKRLATKINLILVEHVFDENPLECTHTMSVNGAISRFDRKK